MTQPQELPALPRPLTIYLRPMAMAATWLALVGLATGCFFAPGAREARTSLYHVFNFVAALGIAGAVAATSALAIGGRRRWAVELVLAVTLLSLIAALLLVYFLWFDAALWRKISPWSFQELLHASGGLPKRLAGFHAPIGVTVGIVLGTIAGLLTILGRRMPRLATGIALVVLFAFASSTVRQFVVKQETWLYWNLLAKLVNWGNFDHEIPITGMIFGGTAGSVIAGFAMYATRPRPSVPTTATPLLLSPNEFLRAQPTK
jgi:hypothetical protein